MKARILAISAALATSGVACAQDRQPAPSPAQQPPPRSAPPPAQQQQQQQQPVQAAEVTDAEVQKFAEIYVAVDQTRFQLTQQMSEAADSAEAQQIQARMREEIVAAIGQHGWSVDKYNAVATAITNDPELRSEALDIINQMSPT